MRPNLPPLTTRSTSTDRIVPWLLGSIYTSVSMVAGSAQAEPAQIGDSRSLGNFTTTKAIADAIAPDATTPPATAIGLEVPRASDIAGNWAEPFIKVLVEQNIIAGYPDGTFRPDKTVTRAEFAALVNRAFSLSPVRAERKFKDVPDRHWASNAIQTVYRGGYIFGYPDGTFAPNRPILRIQSLVALVEGNRIASAGNLDLKGVFGDADLVPSYGRNSLIAATQKCMAVSANYDSSQLPGGNFGGNAPATRADVAAYIHQVLVATGRLPALEKTSAANKYVAACPQGVYVTSISDTTPRAATAPDLGAKDAAVATLKVSEPLPNLARNVINLYPVGGLTTPNAFGSSWGNAFVGTSYQSSSRAALYLSQPNSGQTKADGAVYLGFGVGDAQNSVGVETIVTSYATANNFLSQGSVSFKVHKQLSDRLAIAGGVENAIPWVKPGGGLDGGQTGYGVASLVLNPDPNVSFLSNTTLSLGGGAGRFRSVGDIRSGRDSYGVFGSIGTRLSPNLSFIADWNGQDLNVGLPITIELSENSTIQLVPAVVDLVNRETGGSRFIVNGGVGFRF